MCDKKKVAIITIYNENNYGNRLQNYAVQKCMKKWGFASETIVISKPVSIISKLKATIKKIIFTLLLGYVKHKRPEYIKKSKFLKFTRKYIPTRYVKSMKNTFSQNIGEQYDIFVIGSDQVWNPCFGDFEELYENMFLTFVPDVKKRCFSPSFGVKKIPDEWKSRFKEGLSKFPYINVREKSGVDIVKELTGKDAVLTIDPTLMLDAAEWNKISTPVKGLPDKYILDYFLGETPCNDLNYNSISCDNGEKVRVRLLDKSDRNIYISGPSEFVYLISNADLICTDSFHACVFSILFCKPFIVFNRQDENNDMLTRIENLLNLFDIDIKDNLGKKIFIEKNKVDTVLSHKRKEMKSFFQN